MRYQDLIDKYTNPNGYSTASNLLSYNRLEPTKSTYQVERELKRSRSRGRLEYNTDSSSYIQRFHTDPYTSSNTTSHHLFTPAQSDITATNTFSNFDRLRPPRISQDLRKTTGPDYSYRDTITKQLNSYHSSTNNLLTANFDKKYDLARDMSYDNLRQTISGGRVTTGRAGEYNWNLKENNGRGVEEGKGVGYLAQSSHNRRETPNVNEGGNDRLFMSSVGMASGKSSRHLNSFQVPREAKIQSVKSTRDITTQKSPPHTSSKFQPQSPPPQLLISSPQATQGTLGPCGFTTLTKSDFQLGKCKGQGKFGKIYPCRHLKTNTLYALKQIPKKLIKQHMMQDQLLRQLKLQYFFNHSNLVKLYAFFSDYQNIYLLMQYMQQGQLYSLLKKQKKFSQPYTASRVYEICEGLGYLHDMDVVHRDIKLENVVLSNGVAKLCDFGWAAVLDGRRTTYCGTFDYAPPEIIQGKEYDQHVDLWSLGVMTFEMLTGQLPFYSISRSETIKNILNVQQKKINFPPDMSQKAQSFIEKLLRKNPDERINIAMLLKHPFLQDCSKTHKKF